jgi:hypothetical protein
MKVLKPFKIGDRLVPIGDLTICQFMFLCDRNELRNLIEKGYLEAIEKKEIVNDKITLL